MGDYDGLFALAVTNLLILGWIWATGHWYPMGIFAPVTAFLMNRIAYYNDTSKTVRDWSLILTSLLAVAAFVAALRQDKEADTPLSKWFIRITSVIALGLAYLFPMVEWLRLPHFSGQMVRALILVGLAFLVVGLGVAGIAFAMRKARTSGSPEGPRLVRAEPRHTHRARATTPK